MDTAQCVPHLNTAHTNAAKKHCEQHNTKHSQTCKFVGKVIAWHPLQSHQAGPGACLGMWFLGNMSLRFNL